MAKNKIPNICIIDGCGRPVNGHGYCSMHWKRWRKHGDPMLQRKPIVCDKWFTGSAEFDRHITVDTETGCWEYSPRKGNGYGQISIKVNGERVYIGAHRYAYMVLVGDIPPGLQIDHLCRNRGCCNPFHLEAVTSKENIGRSPFKLLNRTHCKNGHLLTDENRIPVNSLKWTGYACRDCRRMWSKACKARERAAKCLIVQQ